MRLCRFRCGKAMPFRGSPRLEATPPSQKRRSLKEFWFGRKAGGFPQGMRQSRREHRRLSVRDAAEPPRTLRLGRLRWRVAGHAAIEKHLDFHPTILRAPRSRRIFSYKFRLTETHWGDETTQGNLMSNGQVLDH
jgi:hypothetical protein